MIRISVLTPLLVTCIGQLWVLKEIIVQQHIYSLTGTLVIDFQWWPLRSMNSGTSVDRNELLMEEGDIHLLHFASASAIRSRQIDNTLSFQILDVLSTGFNSQRYNRSLKVDHVGQRKSDHSSKKIPERFWRCRCVKLPRHGCKAVKAPHAENW